MNIYQFVEKPSMVARELVLRLQLRSSGFRRMKYLCILLPILIGTNTLMAQHTSEDNYTGTWTNPVSWNPDWATPITTGIAQNITIYGYITHSGNIDFGGSGGDLIVYDTLVIEGNLVLGNNNNITVHEGGILFVKGSLTIANKVDIQTDAYIIVLGDFTKTGTENQGSFTSSDTPSNVFIGGTITVPGDWASTGAGDVFNCDSTVVDSVHYNSQCNYGNYVDITEDTINNFVESTCTVFPEITTQPQNAVVCTGNNATFTVVATNVSTYQWMENQGAGYVRILNGGIYSGVTTSTLTLTGVTASMDGYGYRCVLKSAQGCITTSNGAVLSVGAPDAAGTITGTAAVCQGQTGVAYSVPAILGATGYQWVLPTGATIATGSNTNSITVDFSTTAASGNITVRGTNTCGNGAYSPAFAVTVNTTPAPAKLTGPTTTCAGAVGDNYSVTNNVAWTYSWSIEDAVGTITSGTGTNSINVNWKTNAEILSSSTNITKNVTVNVSIGSCSSNVVWAVTIYRVPETGPQYHIPNNYGL